MNHYITVNENGIIIDGFSNAHKAPSGTDLKINSAGGRHFSLNGIENPPLFDSKRRSLYKLESPYGYPYTVADVTWIKKRTEEEIVPISDLKQEKITAIKASAKALLSTTDWESIRHRDQEANGETTSLTSQEYTDLLNSRKSIRDQSNTFESNLIALTDYQDVKNFTWTYS